LQRRKSEAVVTEHHPQSGRNVNVAANDKPLSPSYPVQIEKKAAHHERPRFEIYRTDRVSLTSTLFGGGDWHWRLTSADGALLADCGGFKSREGCRAAVVSVRDVAGQATMPPQE
jgi:uncharacterized protein YegP (UPF0339 family)